MGWYSNFTYLITVEPNMNKKQLKIVVQDQFLNLKIEKSGNNWILSDVVKKGHRGYLESQASNIRKCLGKRFVYLEGSFKGEDFYAEAEIDVCDREIILCPEEDNC